MKIEKAIEILKEQKLFTPLGQACFVAVSALEKQIPKAVIKYEHALHDSYACPNCKYGGVEFDYCSVCGQELDWGDEND